MLIATKFKFTHYSLFKFSFKPISKLDIEKKVKLMNPKKASASDSIPPKILEVSSEVSAEVLQIFFNDLLKTGNFIPVFKKNNPLQNVNYRPVSGLLSISKVFEKLM